MATVSCVWMLCLGITVAQTAPSKTASPAPSPAASPEAASPEAASPKAASPKAGALQTGATKTQTPTASNGATKTPPPLLRFRTFDTVLAIVGEKVITLSEVQPGIDAEMLKHVESRQRRNPDYVMSVNEKRMFIQGWAWSFAQQRAHKLQMLGNIRNMPVPEERVQQAIDDNVNRRIQKDTREAGSTMALYRNLRIQGKTFEEYRAELRDQITYQIIQSQTYSKYMDGGNLKVTPAQMWDYYRQNSKNYQREAKARIEIFQLDLNEDEEAALAKAAQLRRDLMEGGDVRKTRRKYRAIRNVREVRPDGGHVRILTDFAFSESTRVGSYSQPKISDRIVYVIHLLSKQSGGLKGFKEVAVQRDIRAKLLRGRLIELDRKLQTTRGKNLSIWPPALMISQTPRWPR